MLIKLPQEQTGAVCALVHRYGGLRVWRITCIFSSNVCQLFTTCIRVTLVMHLSVNVLHIM